MKLIFMEGCQRSGNHLIAQWICGHTSHIHIDNFNYSVYEQRDGHLFGHEEPDYEDQVLQATRPFHKHGNNINHGIIGYEHPGLMSDEKYARVVQALLAIIPGSSFHYFHLLRDPYNWIASYARLMARNKIYGWNDKGGEKIVPDEYLKNNYLRFHDVYWDRWLRSYAKWSSSSPASQINYNIFVANEQYRRHLAATLGIDFSVQKDTLALSKLPRQGSSFDTQDREDGDGFLLRYESIVPLLKMYGIPNSVQTAAKKHFPELHNSVAIKLKSSDRE